MHGALGGNSRGNLRETWSHEQDDVIYGDAHSKIDAIFYPSYFCRTSRARARCTESHWIQIRIFKFFRALNFARELISSLLCKKIRENRLNAQRRRHIKSETEILLLSREFFRLSGGSCVAPGGRLIRPTIRAEKNLRLGIRYARSIRRCRVQPIPVKIWR